MKTHLFSRFAACLLAAATLPFVSAPLGAQGVLIQPLGDSITLGVGGTAEEGGYRQELDDLLFAADWTVDFVGTLNTNGANMLDSDHEGHSGNTIAQIDAGIAGWLNAVADPDIVLLHIGTNDFGGGGSDPTAIDRLDTLITKIANLRPNSHIIVTNLLERSDPTSDGNIQAEFNPFVETRVNAQVAAGNLVSYLDMRSLVPLVNIPDGVHPDQTGYDQMAAGWLGAILAVVDPGDGVVPALVRARGTSAGDVVYVNFNKQVDQGSAETVGNYAIDNGINVLSATLSANERYVTLTTDTQVVGTTYTVTVNNVDDKVLPTANTIAANSTAQFTAPIQPGYENNAPESDCYTLVYSLDLPNAANYGLGSPPYAVDIHESIGTYDRVAYYMELQTSGGDLQYAWASMDAFDTNPANIGVPTLAAGVTFQQSVSNLNVVSNVVGVTTGEGQTGNLEFWPTNYQNTNGASVPGASDSLYDFGDNISAGNYGSMQVHNTTGAQTVISFSKWGGSGGNACVGIGNQPTGQPDWTFANNAADYSVKKLQVLVRTTGDLTAPTLASAQASFDNQSITVTFSEPVRRDTLLPANFSLDNGVTVLEAEAGDDLRTVRLLTTTLPGAALTLTVNNLRDTSHNANQIAPASTIAVAAAALPAEVIANIAGDAAGYELVYSLDIPVTGNLNGINPYAIDNSAKGGAFSRIAYYLELQSGATTNYIWTAMDAFTQDKGKIGVPTFSSGAIFQQNVANLDVISNKGGITTGTGITTGNIEFWPTNYSGPNALSIPNASGTNFDWGDTRSAGGNYGCMQVHNSATLQTLFALNHFGVNGLTLDVGIGNDPTPTNNGVDWTFAANAGTEYSKRTLHVMVLPAPLPAEITANVPESTGYELVYTLDIPSNGNLAGPGAGFTDYVFNDSGRTAPFSRVAYYLELQKTGDPEPTYVWTSMDAFTQDRSKIGVPTVGSGAFWQQLVSNLNVVSNSPNVTNGTGLATGNIEFWPSNYNGTNFLNIPNASDAFDFGDGGAGTNAGYGSMQIHNHDIDGTGAGTAGETLFAINRWGTAGNTGNPLCVGIGNDPNAGNGTDWTFEDNAPSVDLLRRLHVLVLPGDGPPPLILDAVGSTTLDRLVVTFDREVTGASAIPGNFSLDGGLTVTGATLLPGNKDIALTTSPQIGGTLYTVDVSGVRDRSGGSLILPGTSIQFTSYTADAILANVPDTGMELIYHLNIPAAVPRWNINRIPYEIDEAKYGEIFFDRVAYLLELDGDWAYVSFDPHTNQIAQTGIPNTAAAPSAFFQLVTNMNVDSNVAGVVTGNGIATGNIEFWGQNYNNTNANSVPNASDTIHDFGDVPGPGVYGTLQVHNHGASQTILAYNNWGSNSGGSSDVGIGNNPVPPAQGATDWTFMGNAGDYTTRNLYVLARPGGSAAGNGPVITRHPCDRTAFSGQDVSMSVSVDGDGPFTYQWRLNGTPIGGATQPWLELSAVNGGDAGAYDVIVTGTNLSSTTSDSGTLIIDESNQPPIFSGYAFSMQRDGTAIIPLSAILANASDPDGDPVDVTAAVNPSTAGGAVALGASDLTYTPTPGFTGSDSISITIEDGQGGSVMGSVSVFVSQQAIDPNGGDTVAFLPGGGPGAGVVEGVFHGTPGVEYGFQRSDSGTGYLTGWTVLSTGTAGDDGIIIFNDPNPPTPEAYYRTITPVPVP